MMMKETYKERQNEVITKIGKLLERLERHEKSFKDYPNWPMIGDMGRLNADLSDILKYFNL